MQGLIEQYKLLYKQKPYYGQTGSNKTKHILPIIQEYGIESILDYGCGYSKLVDNLRQKYGYLSIYRYDPAIEKYSKVPIKSVDLIICTDVLEHIPEIELDEILTDIRCLAPIAFFTISTRVAGNILPNGENCHPTVRSKEWWEMRIRKFYFFTDILYESSEGIHILAKGQFHYRVHGVRFNETG